MKKVGIMLEGCDDSTCFNIEVTDEQYKTLEELQKISKETSQFSCMPIFKIQKPFEEDDLYA